MTQFAVQRDHRVAPGVRRLIPEGCCGPRRKYVSFVGWVGMQLGFSVALLRCGLCGKAWEAHYILPKETVS